MLDWAEIVCEAQAGEPLTIVMPMQIFIDPSRAWPATLIDPGATGNDGDFVNIEED